MKHISNIPIAFLLWICALSQAQAQGLPTLEDLRVVTDGAMTKVGSGDIEGGLRAIKPLVAIPPAEFESMMGQLPMQLPVISGRFGKSIGYEFIYEQKFGESLAKLVYINRLEKHAMRWVFYVYKGSSGWTINTFRYDEKWHELF